MKYLFVVLVVLMGCKATKSTYRKVATDINVTTEKKAIIAPWVSVNFPNQTIFITGPVDTVETVFYDEDAVNELNKLLDSLLLLPKDSVLKILKEKCTPVVKTVKITKIDTVQINNGAVVFSLQRALALSENENVKAVDDKNKALELVEKRTRQRNILIGILFCLSLIIGLSIYYKVRL